MTDAVVKATYADYRRVKGRKVLQIICEVPLEHAPLVHRLFGEPTPDESTWVAIAKLDPEMATEAPAQEPDEKTPRKWEDLKPSQQAGIRCNEDAFHKFLRTRIFVATAITGKSKDRSSADMVREYCGVESRATLNNGGNEEWKWMKLEREYQAWLNAPQFGIDG